MTIRGVSIGIGLACIIVSLAGGCMCGGSRSEGGGSLGLPANVPPPPPEHVETEESLARRARSVARLRAEGVPVAETLPVIETVAEARPRSQDAVIARAIALAIVAVKGEGLEQPIVLQRIEGLGATPYFTPNEAAFIREEHPDEQTRAQFTWQYECVKVMLWALGHLPELGPPDEIADAGALVRTVMTERGGPFRAAARLRPIAAILDEADLIYRYDWACVDARINGRPAPDGVSCDIVVERHRALNWLIGYQGQDWDDVSTDT